MNDIFLSSIALKDFETLIRDCVKSELKNYSPEQPPETEYITRKQAAAFLGISLPTLNDWSKQGIIPSYRIGSRVRYKKAEVEASLSKVQSVKYRRVH
jgi:excisionase family DNA binding protein